MSFRFRSFCGSVLDPGFRERSRLTQILSLKFISPYLSFKTSKIPHSKRLKSNLDFFRIVIENQINSESNRFKDLHVFSAFGLQAQNNRLLITSDTSNNPGFSLKKISTRMNFLVDNQIEVETPIATGFTVLPYNFYHFMTDFVFPFLTLGDEDRKLFLPFKPTNRQIEFLGLFGIEFLNAEFQANHVFSDALILPTIFKKQARDSVPPLNPSSRYVFDEVRLEKARIAIRENISSELKTESTKVFLSRRGASRSPENILEIEKFFENQKFIVYNSQDFNFTETIKIFKNADLIVGIHGAGLTNIAFAQPHCRVIEIEPITHKMGGEIRPVFKLMAEAFGFEYERHMMPTSLEEWRMLALKLACKL